MVVKSQNQGSTMQENFEDRGFFRNFTYIFKYFLIFNEVF